MQMSGLSEDLVQHYKALTMVYNILIQSSFLGPCPSPIEFLDIKHYILEARPASIFKHVAPNLLDPWD